MAALTKKDIVEEIVSKTGIDHKVASDSLETFFELVKEGLIKDEKGVSLSGFGKWNVRNKNARRGRNPKTGEQITIQPRKQISFHLSNILRKKLG